jgi:hypothetical protein
MKHSFKAEIYKTGINWCVDVPLGITQQMKPEKGYIRIKGKINGFDFKKFLVPVKSGPYRLFVNGIMMKGAKTGLGKTAEFEIAQDFEKEIHDYPIPEALANQLRSHNLENAFNALRESRRKEILKYLSFIKTEVTLNRNIDKLIAQLLQKENDIRIP